MNLPEKKVAIIGANGYLGRNLSFFLHQRGHLIQNFDVQDCSEHSWMSYEKLDIRDEKSLSKIDPENDFVLFFSGITGAWNGFNNYKNFIELNEIGLLNVLNYLRISKSKSKIIFPSSRLVYKGIKNEQISEDGEKETKTIYAINKLSGEKILKLYFEMFGIQYTIYRISVPYGNIVGKDYSYGTVGFFLNQAEKQNQLTLYGDGSLRRTFTYIEDVCNLISLSMVKTEATNEIYNIGGENYSLLEIASHILSKFKNGSIKHVPWDENNLKVESGDTIFNSNKIDTLCNYQYKQSFKSWLDQIF